MLDWFFRLRLQETYVKSIGGRDQSNAIFRVWYKVIDHQLGSKMNFKGKHKTGTPKKIALSKKRISFITYSKKFSNYII